MKSVHGKSQIYRQHNPNKEHISWRLKAFKKVGRFSAETDTSATLVEKRARHENRTCGNCSETDLDGRECLGNGAQMSSIIDLDVFKVIQGNEVVTVYSAFGKTGRPCEIEIAPFRCGL